MAEERARELVIVHGRRDRRHQRDVCAHSSFDLITSFAAHLARLANEEVVARRVRLRQQAPAHELAPEGCEAFDGVAEDEELEDSGAAPPLGQRAFDGKECGGCIGFSRALARSQTTCTALAPLLIKCMRHGE